MLKFPGMASTHGELWKFIPAVQLTAQRSIPVEYLYTMAVLQVIQRSIPADISPSPAAYIAELCRLLPEQRFQLIFTPAVLLILPFLTGQRKTVILSTIYL